MKDQKENNKELTSKELDLLVNSKELDILFYYDGPLLSLQKTKDGVFFLKSTQEFNEKRERYLWINIYPDTLQDFLTSKVDLLNVIKKSEQLYMQRIDNNNISSWSIVDFKSLNNNDELPKDGFFVKLPELAELLLKENVDR